jgi:DNA mismatch repair ATPase MutL
LASISYVAKLSVTTMTEGALHGWRVTYEDGEEAWGVKAGASL